ncbi:MAG: hypothetical protein KAX26_10590 [Anaerolineae bacterium]|nr:hypothetical protein [Anaerolineae bacterium]
MNERTRRQRNFSPLRDKTLSSVLRQLFVTEFGYESKVIFAFTTVHFSHWRHSGREVRRIPFLP